MSWTDYRDRVEDDAINIAIATVQTPTQDKAQEDKVQAWEVIVHYTINAHNHCYRWD